MRGPAGTGLVGASIELKNRLRSSLSNILVLDILPIPYCVVDMRVPTKTHRRFQLSVYPLTRFHPRPLCRHACAHVHDQYSSYFVNSMNPMCSLYLAFVKVYSKYMLLYSWVLTKRWKSQIDMAYELIAFGDGKVPWRLRFMCVCMFCRMFVRWSRIRCFTLLEPVLYCAS